MFTMDNTEGYTQTELDALNAELADRLEGLEPGTDEYSEVEKCFNDEVARR
jgi:hypothetical protein